MKQSIGIKNNGFTLVELMVVVAIIGILSAIAIPNFKSYQAKAKASEAKIQLASVYQAESSLQSDYDSYATCLSYAGYEGPGGKSYYAIGFSGTGGNSNIRANGGDDCTDTDAVGVSYWDAGKTVAGVKVQFNSITVAIPSDYESGGISDAGQVNSDGTAFVAKAVGAIDSDAVKANNENSYSQFIINQNKDLREIKKGY